MKTTTTTTTKNEMGEKMKTENIPTQPKKETYERIRNRGFKIVDIVGVTDKEENLLMQIRFSGILEGEEDAVVITYSPKKYKEDRIKCKGFPFVKKYSEKPRAEDIPEMVKDVYEKINEFGSIDLDISFTRWNTQDNEGNDVSYNFFTEKDIENIKYL